MNKWSWQILPQGFAHPVPKGNPLKTKPQCLWQGPLHREGTTPFPENLSKSCQTVWQKICLWLPSLDKTQPAVAFLRAGRFRIGATLTPGDPFAHVRVWSRNHWALADPFAFTGQEDTEPLPQLPHLVNLLKGPDSAFYLGGAQALVDGARISLGNASSCDQKCIDQAANLWRLLPFSVRAERTIALPDPNNTLQADLTGAIPETDESVWQGERLGDYPEGRYEWNLHEAIDQGDLAMVHKLLKRQSPKQVFLMGLLLILGFIIIGALFGI